MAAPTAAMIGGTAALVLLATFASLRWGEATALRRCDLDLERALCGYGPPTWSARPGKCCSARPSPGPGGASSVSLTRSFRRCASTLRLSSRTSRARSFSRRQRAVRYGGATSTRCRAGRTRCVDRHAGLHFHDLRHTGNQFAAAAARLKDLMARMGHDSERAALIYQHQARGADQRSRMRSTPTSRPSSAKATMTRTASAGHWSPLANGTLMARKLDYGSLEQRGRGRDDGSDLGLRVGAGDGNRTRTISLGS